MRFNDVGATTPAESDKTNVRVSNCDLEAYADFVKKVRASGTDLTEKELRDWWDKHHALEWVLDFMRDYERKKKLVR